MKIQMKVNKWDLIKLKSFWILKKPWKNENKTHRMRENEAINKGFISKIYKQLM